MTTLVLIALITLAMLGLGLIAGGRAAGRDGGLLDTLGQGSGTLTEMGRNGSPVELRR